MLQLDVQLPRRVRAAALGVERATRASHATRDGAHLVLHSPFLEQNREAGPAMLVGALRMILASLAAAAAGARGVCAPRAAAPAPSPRRLPRCSPQESCSSSRCSVFGSPWASPQVSLALRSFVRPRASRRGGASRWAPAPPRASVRAAATPPHHPCRRPAERGARERRETCCLRAVGSLEVVVNSRSNLQATRRPTLVRSLLCRVLEHLAAVC